MKSTEVQTLPMLTAGAKLLACGIAIRTLNLVAFSVRIAILEMLP